MVNGIVTTTGSPYLDVSSTGIGRIDNVPDEDLRVILKLLQVWKDKYPRNLLRGAYADAKYRFNDFSISIPDRIRAKAQPMIGWPAKAVRSLADLSVFEGFSVPGDSDPHGIAELAESNSLDMEVPQAISSAYTHSCSFLTVSGDTDDASRILITPRSADWSAAIWDRRRRRISSALTITGDDKYGRITSFTAWLPTMIYECTRSGGSWSAEPRFNFLKRPPVVPFAYDAQLNRPFGRSRITRSLMSLTDMGFRTLVRMEATAEFYSVPKLWFLGADPDAFSTDTWSSLVSAINAIGKDEDGDMPQLQQISQASMQPHSDMLKTIALMVASETALPVNDLGITMDNPASAEAMAAAERKLSREADRQNRQFGRSLKDAITMAVQYREHTPIIPDDLTQVQPVWAPTREISDAARSDSFGKLATAITGFADSEVGLARAGLSQSEIVRLKADQKRQAASAAIAQLDAKLSTEKVQEPQTPSADSTDEPPRGQQS
ncbi:MAG: phage portal protein [Bifidobacteriaceae bacterium]|jgi:hypothetical protein|nr:phage portal protein [Bifidobacteriaceae bacterium]